MPFAMLLKIEALFLRLYHFAVRLPVRFWRLVVHLKNGAAGLFRGKNNRTSVAVWWIELTFYLLDLLGVPDLYETLMDFSKWKTRPLSERELQLAKSVFGNTIQFRRVRIDEGAHIACKRNRLCYVSFYTINSWGAMRDEIFIHELVHVWQYQMMGAVYIPRALLAQKTLMGYNYGGVSGLKACLKNGGNLQDFNLEQQADIVSDYFSIREDWFPRWGNGTKEDLAVYEQFMQQIRPAFA